MPESALRRVLSAPVRSQAGPLTVSASLTVLRIAADLARPWPLALAVDYAIDGSGDIGFLRAIPPAEMLVLAASATVVLSALGGLLDMAGVAIGERAAERVGAQLRTLVFRRSLALSIRWHDRVRSAELVSRLTTDVGRVLDAVVAATATLFADVVAVVGVLVVLFLIDPLLALVGLVTLPMLALLCARQRDRVRGAQRAARAESGRLTSVTTDFIRNVRAVQAFGGTDRAVAAFETRNRSLLDVELTAVTTEARWIPRADIVLAVGGALVLVAGGLQVRSGTQTTGHLLVVIAYLRELYAPVRGLTRLASVLAKATASAQRIAEILDADDAIVDRPDARALPRRPHAVAFADVGFAYAPARPALRRFRLDVAPGETVCLFGASGSGKSTALLLLLRLYDVDQGAVLVDGVDIRDYQVAALREQIAFVPQDPWLLDATLAQNIAFGSPDATRAGVLAAGRQAHLDDFTGGLPLGYDTPLGEGGGRLSGGQRRRVALARAVVSRAPVLLLDEPTASLDSDAAQVVADAVRATAQDRTTLLVTHDPLLADIADRVIAVDDCELGPAVRPVTGSALVQLTGGR